MQYLNGARTEQFWERSQEYSLCGSHLLMYSTANMFLDLLYNKLNASDGSLLAYVLFLLDCLEERMV